MFSMVAAVALVIIMIVAFMPQQTFAGDAVDVATLKDSTTSQYKVSATDPSTVYWKIVPKYSGYVSFVAKGSKGTVTLCNSSKTAISEDLNVSTSTKTYFGVKAGKTYFVKAYSTAKQQGDGYFYVNGYYKSYKADDKYGKTKATALSIKADTNMYSYFAGGATSAKWYKYYKQTRYISLSFYSYACKDVTAKVYYTLNGKKNTITLTNGRGKKSAYIRKPLAAKTTVYIKITPADKYTSGGYRILW